MTALDYRVSPMPAARPAIWTRIARGGTALVTRWQHRRAFAKLSELTDRELADIGLLRRDLDTVQAQGGDEPTALLNGIVTDRLRREFAARRVC